MQSLPVTNAASGIPQHKQKSYFCPSARFAEPVPEWPTEKWIWVLVLFGPHNGHRSHAPRSCRNCSACTLMCVPCKMGHGPWEEEQRMWCGWEGAIYSQLMAVSATGYIYIKTYVDIHPQYHPQCHPINTIPIIPTLTISHPFNTNLPKKTWLSRELAHICVTDHATGVFNVRWMGFYMYMMLYIILFLSHTHIYICIYDSCDLLHHYVYYISMP